MTQEDFDSAVRSLSDFERKVWDYVVAQSPKPTSYEAICAGTLIDPDIVLHVIVVLARKGLVDVGSEDIHQLLLLASQPV